MKKYLLVLFLLTITVNSFSQILKPVKWEFKTKQIADNEYELQFIANMDDHWAIYSQHIGKGGPRPTTFTFENPETLELIDNIEEPTENKVSKNDPLFNNMLVTKFYKQAIFTQKIKIKDKNQVIKGKLSFMTCNDEKCLPPTKVPFTFSFLDTATTKGNANTIKTSNINDAAVNKLLYGDAFKDVKLTTAGTASATNSAVNSENSKSLWGIFIIAFLSGFAALLTPCVFPMIPMTVSYFTKQSKSKAAGIKNAVIYGLSIIAIYVFLGSVVTAIFGSEALNLLSTNVWFNVIFFLILVFFAFSFFGFYELTLPSSWATKIDSQADRSGFIGIFFMALALAVVSFSCTGPIVGSLLVEAASKGGLAPVVGMLGFSSAIALPFALFAAFPGWLNSLPKSGGWLNTVKVVLGFLELALAFKFLSNADLVAHWGILKYELFIGIWVVTFGLLAIYLFGKIKFPHDSPIKKLSFLRICTGVLVAAFTVYLISGFRSNNDGSAYKPLPLLSGLAPAVGYSFFKPAECPNSLTCFKDLKEGLAYAKKVNKPVLLDFTGYACVNCRKMEEHVWTKPKIDKYLRNDYVLISLYVDDKKELPKNQQVEVNKVNGGTSLLETYGDKWAHFQTVYFKTNSQPYYVLLSPDGSKVLNTPVGYTPNVDEYAGFLQEGL